MFQDGESQAGLGAVTGLGVGAGMGGDTGLGVGAGMGVGDDAEAGLGVGESYGLRAQCLTATETLAQSIATIAPSTSPTLTIPLVFALAGQGTWLAYALALVAVTLIALVVAEFARGSASPGSLYVYVRKNLPPWCAVVAAWAMLFAYAMTAGSLLAGFVSYGYVMLGRWPPYVGPVVMTVAAAGVAVAIAWREIQISARLMLWLQVGSVALILVVLAVVLWGHGMHVDRSQATLHGVTGTGVRLGVMLAIFSFVGFESSTTLGAEAQEPLRTIPRAVVRSAVLAGVFFLLSAYAEVLGFRAAGQDFGASTAPMRVLADAAGMRWVGRLIDVGVLVSLFAGALACLVAAARVVLLMAQHGLTHARLGRVHATRSTPGVAGLAVGLIATAPVVALLRRGVGPADVYGWMGTLSVYGFLTAYGLVALALPVYLRRRGELTGRKLVLAMAAGGATVVAMVGTMVPLPPAPYRYFPYVYLGYLGLGLAWYGWKARVVKPVGTVVGTAVPVAE